MQLKTLTAFKNGLGTILINEKNQVVSYYPKELKQPHRNRKTITHNCFKYSLEWIKPKDKKEKHWFNQTVLAVSKKAYKTFFNSKTEISDDYKKMLISDSKKTPLTIEFLNNYQFVVKLNSTFNF